MTTITHEQPAQAPAQETRDQATIPVSGILDALGDGGAFVRTSGYRMGRDDVYVPADQVRKYGLRRGDHLEGAARPAGQGSGGGPSRRSKTAAAAKHPALARIDAINGLESGAVEDAPRLR